MHLYIRLMKRYEPDTYSSVEQEVLQAFLAAAPGVQIVKTLERDSKGGYSVTLDVEPSEIESLSEHVSSHGFMLVM
jgi:hypothetical protein